MQKRILITALSILLVSSCASYSPEQLQAKASDKTNFDLCFDMVLPNPNMYSKQELMNRGVNCNDYATEVLEARRKQLQMAQALMAFGNAMQGQAQSTYIPPVGSLPDYSNKQPTAIKKYLTSRKALDNGRTECTYGVGITATVIVNYGSFCAPSI